jgi:hypothetical protein
MLSKPNEDMINKLIDRFGLLIGGQDLYLALGYKTYSAFHRSNQRNELGVHVFKLPRRRGWFALSIDVANWLEEQSKH